MTSAIAETSSDARKNTPESSHIRKCFTVVDLFCGAGGTSTGASKAIEEMGAVMDLIAVNHWPIAVETHQMNHPAARHYITDVETADPEALVPEGKVDLLLASPECRYHSRARGGKPVHDQGRMQPWSIMNWLTKLDVNAVVIENVREFVGWGPLDEDKLPIKERKGEYFQAWYLALAALGYNAEWKILNAADYGEATTRSRFFLQARKDGQPILWPEPTHSKTGATTMLGALPKWRGAREIIDWTDRGKSLLDHPQYRKKPLAVNTRRRIAKGLEKFGGPLAPLYIALLDLPPEEAPPKKKTREQKGAMLSDAFILNRNGENGTSRCHSLDSPAPTAVARGAGYLVAGEASHFVAANRNENAPRDVQQPVPVIMTPNGGGLFLVEASSPAFTLGQQSCAAARDTTQPTATITGDGAISLTQPAIVEYYGNSTTREPERPLSAVLPIRKHGVVTHAAVPCNGTEDDHDSVVLDSNVIEVNHGNGKQGHNGNARRVHSSDAPLPPITTIPGFGMAQTMVIRTSQTGSNQSYARNPEEPVWTITTKNDLAIADPAAAMGEHAWDDGIDPRRRIIIDGVPCLLDIRFRMLKNRELARAMGFDDEEQTYEFVGNSGEITKQIGNAVPVRLAAALVTCALSQTLKAEQRAVEA